MIQNIVKKTNIYIYIYIYVLAEYFVLTKGFFKSSSAQDKINSRILDEWIGIWYWYQEMYFHTEAFVSKKTRYFLIIYNQYF